MSIDIGGFLEEAAKWVGINFALDKILLWLENNGALGLTIIALLSLPVCLIVVHKSGKIPVKVPFAQGLGRLNITLLLSFYLAAVLIIGAMFIREVVTSPAEPADQQIPPVIHKEAIKPEDHDDQWDK